MMGGGVGLALEGGGELLLAPDEKHEAVHVPLRDVLGEDNLVDLGERVGDLELFGFDSEGEGEVREHLFAALVVVLVLRVLEVEFGAEAVELAEGGRVGRVQVQVFEFGLVGAENHHALEESASDVLLGLELLVVAYDSLLELAGGLLGGEGVQLGFLGVLDGGFFLGALSGGFLPGLVQVGVCFVFLGEYLHLLVDVVVEVDALVALALDRALRLVGFGFLRLVVFGGEDLGVLDYFVGVVVLVTFLDGHLLGDGVVEFEYAREVGSAVLLYWFVEVRSEVEFVFLGELLARLLERAFEVAALDGVEVRAFVGFLGDVLLLEEVVLALGLAVGLRCVLGDRSLVLVVFFEALVFPVEFEITVVLLVLVVLEVLDNMALLILLVLGSLYFNQLSY